MAATTVAQTTHSGIIYRGLLWSSPRAHRFGHCVGRCSGVPDGEAVFGSARTRPRAATAAHRARLAVSYSVWPGEAPRPSTGRFHPLTSPTAAASANVPSNYPPYNIVKVSEDNYRIELALSGFDAAQQVSK